MHDSPQAGARRAWGKAELKPPQILETKTLSPEKTVGVLCVLSSPHPHPNHHSTTTSQTRPVCQTLPS